MGAPTFDPKRCYLCGLRDDNLTKEHVASRTLYENGKIPGDNGAIVLPAHRECNASTSKDEEWLATVFATVPAGVRSDKRWIRAVKGLTRPEAVRFKEAFEASIAPLPSGGAAVTIDPARVGNVFVKMAKGIWYAKEAVFIGDDHRWGWTQVSPVTFQAYAADLTHEVRVHDVLFARYGRIDSTYFTLIAIHGGHGRLVIATASDSLPSDAKGAVMTWPRPSRVAH